MPGPPLPSHCNHASLSRSEWVSLPTVSLQVGITAKELGLPGQCWIFSYDIAVPRKGASSLTCSPWRSPDCSRSPGARSHSGPNPGGAVLPRRQKTATRRAPRRRPCAMPTGCLQGGGGLLRGADGRTVGFMVRHNDQKQQSAPDSGALAWGLGISMPRVEARS